LKASYLNKAPEEKGKKKKEEFSESPNVKVVQAAAKTWIHSAETS